MKIALICPSNLLYMPYVSNYEKILRETNIDYTIIYWDRLHIEENNDEIKYRDKKVGFQRNYFDYFKYNNFIIRQLNKKKYDRVIVFTLQIAYFLKNYLIKNYKENYILDIRDYNKIYKFSNFKKLIDSSAFTVISSPGYQIWLPESNKYVVDHNTPVSDLNSLKPLEIKVWNGKVNISTIGFIRHWDVNIDLVNQLKNRHAFNLIFHGEGTINDRLKHYVEKNKINNVQIYGRYKKEEEGYLYEHSTLINILLYDDINSKGVLANRLYNSVLFGKPMLSLQGTYLADQIKKYNLGLVLESFKEMDSKINRYLKEFNELEYENGRVSFFKGVIKDNDYFIHKLKDFTASLPVLEMKLKGRRIYD